MRPHERLSGGQRCPYVPRNRTKMAGLPLPSSRKLEHDRGAIPFLQGRVKPS